jgi:DNA-binding transcriptional LysR family regulator
MINNNFHKTHKQKLASQLSNFDIRLLRVFRTVVECGGFSAAEVELNISRSAISISMSDLEERLGLRLCQRGRAGFSLTDEGKLVYEASQQLMTSLENFRTQVNTIHEKLTGELNIGITDNLVTLEHMRVSKALKALKSEASEVVINIRMIPPNEIERYVLDGGIHVGVVPDLRLLPGLEYSKLYTEESLLYCNYEHPLFNAKDCNLSTKKINTYEAVAPSYPQTAQTRIHYQDLNTTATATDREGVAFLILTGCFVGYLPTHYAKRWVLSGQMRALCEQKFKFITEYHIVLRKGTKPNLVLETFLKEMNVQSADQHQSN